jgi:hypothetical protein
VRPAIEFKKPEDERWDFLGNFTASDEEMAAARKLLKGRDDPLEVLHQLAGILFDTMDVLKKDGYQVRVVFKEDH